MRILTTHAAFNHSAGNDAEAEYDRLRDLARKEGDKMKQCFDRAHETYERGDRAEAKELSEEGKRHQQKKNAYNKQASEFIFRENNAQGRIADDTIDLHGQFVEEAEDIVEARIRDAQARGQTHLHIIVGKGNHSTGRVQKIKPRVEQICQEMGLDYATEENEGRLYVDLSGGRVNVPPPLPAQPGGGYPGGGYSGGGGGQQQHSGGYRPPQGHHQQQGQGQHHQQQGQQGQQEDELEKLAKKFLPKILRKLEGCCIVM
ncbi:smr domain-containing protein [Cercophora scortea]|uniref:Smr domain-containing protein n=1 Tax=Cercophora scortea TaxID=314031 RepID=A0AAE0IY99_9PEZI|nr:smr domain-containing protein [Cercophora scortea]